MSNLSEVFKKHRPLLVFLAVIVVCIGYGYIIWGTEWTEIDRGKFGESFGVIDALFAGLAFAGVIYTILLQKEELQLQREELQETRAEIRGQKKTLQKQNFESSFFQLFGLHNDIVSSIEFNRTNDLNQPETHSGRRFFIYALNQLKKEAVPYQTFFDNHQKHVGHYFSHLYNVIRFVDQSDIKEKKLYTRLIRDQLSTDELGVLFYHGLSKQGSEFKDMIEKYALFEGMRSVLQNGQMEEKYVESAYGEPD